MAAFFIISLSTSASNGYDCYCRVQRLGECYVASEEYLSKYLRPFLISCSFQNPLKIYRSGTAVECHPSLQHTPEALFKISRSVPCTLSCL